MNDIERTVTVTVITNDRVSSYETRSKERAERSFPIDSNPATIAAWAGRTFVGQRADVEKAWPLPKPDQPVNGALDTAQRLETIATAPTDAAAETAGGDVDDLPF